MYTFNKVGFSLYYNIFTDFSSEATLINFYDTLFTPVLMN